MIQNTSDGTVGTPSEGWTVVEIVSSIAPESFGLGYAALNLAAALDRNGANTFLVSVDKSQVAYQACEEARFPRDRLICGPLLPPQRFRFSPGLIGLALKIPHKGKVITHLHGLWTYVSYLAGSLRKSWQCPMVVSPHGSLEPYALKISPRKKGLASMLFERTNLMTASCIWALSQQEEESVRTYGYNGRVQIIPNGVNDAIPCSADEVTDFRSRHKITADHRIMLFLSRIAPKKNLSLLLKTFALNLKQSPNWILVIAGSDEGGHIHEVQALIQTLGIGAFVRIIGQVTGKEKALAFTSASFFVLASHSEGLPIAVLEAMAYSRPVLVTDSWTLPVQTSARLGWRVQLDECAFSDVLLEAMSTSDEDRTAMGQEARAVVQQHFGWDSIATQACELYSSLLA